MEKIAAYASVVGISAAGGWQTITPDAHGDWLRQRDDSFSDFIVMGNKDDKNALALFANYSNGIKTNSDAWCYNFSKSNLTGTMKRLIAHYNNDVNCYLAAGKSPSIDAYLTYDPQAINWHSGLVPKAASGRLGDFDGQKISPSLYRPFTKEWLYYCPMFNQRVAQMPRIFPETGVENLVICAAGVGARSFSVLIADAIPCLDNIEKGQCFPLYLYDIAAAEAGNVHPSLFDTPQAESKPIRRDAITDAGLVHFQAAYPNEVISKEDLFYYIYGLLHSPDYRERYADNLSKELPRIPRVKTAADFWVFSKAGRALADLHLNYETVEKYPLTIEVKGKRVDDLSDADYRVEKMKLAKKGELSTVIYNSRITLKDIPPEAWDYVVNGKPALDWVMESQSVKTNKASGIVNDANDWAIETMHNPKYPLELFQRVVTVSLESMKIVKSLPALKIF